MDVHNTDMEAVCHVFKRHVEYMGMDDLSVSFSRVDVQDKTVNTISTNYPWHIAYWESGLHKVLHRRLCPGLHLWESLDNKHLDTLRASTSDITKIDFVTQHGSKYDLLSVSAVSPISFGFVQEISHLKTQIEDLSEQCWGKHKEALILPYVGQTSVQRSLEMDELRVRRNEGYQFGRIKLSQDELDTIRHMLQWKSVKEISIINRSSEFDEARRINGIKQKFGCLNKPDSELFKQLVKQGVTLACLDSYTMSR
ncbi:hypothetical protein MHO82_22460 [Vibrio sp. Of7-15]|uniref:hypothetical protein n=1 Tax=Vibrio sp. Of7-15 TaxID=2724879 RepID=UPI001EF18211|nr:hypothetical protein [Vibrio sp. Of7-15]MCG7499631.1 hypothetical protein [Vibrio sp. Of7-15]